MIRSGAPLCARATAGRTAMTATSSARFMMGLRMTGSVALAALKVCAVETSKRASGGGASGNQRRRPCRLTVIDDGSPEFAGGDFRRPFHLPFELVRDLFLMNRRR